MLTGSYPTLPTPLNPTPPPHFLPSTYPIHSIHPIDTLHLLHPTRPRHPTILTLPLFIISYSILRNPNQPHPTPSLPPTDPTLVHPPTSHRHPHPINPNSHPSHHPNPQLPNPTPPTPTNYLQFTHLQTLPNIRRATVSYGTCCLLQRSNVCRVHKYKFFLIYSISYFLF